MTRQPPLMHACHMKQNKPISQTAADEIDALMNDPQFAPEPVEAPRKVMTPQRLTPWHRIPILSGPAMPTADERLKAGSPHMGQLVKRGSKNAE